MPIDTLAAWHELVETHNAAGLDALLADDAVFHSPIVHTPQRGKAITKLYLSAAFAVFFNPTFRYVRELKSANDAMLEFQVEIDGISVNGIDLFRWNDAGQIVDFKVMVRPLKAINLIHQKMAALLQAGGK
ncbi:MAG TPA: nuclear transport factor 2 family protein [Polyangiales bacterium]|nr:nuclear transport factor 2 family protein [Polyangiales bacterium]